MARHSTSTAQVASFDLYGAKITPLASRQLLDLLDAHIRSNQQCVIASQNMHGLYVRLWDSASRQLHSLPRTYVHIDGMPIVALCRLNGLDVTPEHRVTLNDFIWPLLELAAQRGWRVAYVGSTDAVLAAGAAEIQARLPHLLLAGQSGYFRTPQEAADGARRVAAFRPQLILVGMGMGTQERWILKNLASLAPACVLTVGACMEYIAGAANTPPRWMGRLGGEWLFRLIENPKRFWHRYLIEPWFVLAYIAWYSAQPEIVRLAGRFEELHQHHYHAPTLQAREVRETI
jgi:N-acetylglucosaminyldiphosphoundecaprenol N-acetyl-beta-D-mannosaminyltransferase